MLDPSISHAPYTYTSKSVFDPHEIDILVSECEATKTSNTSKNSTESLDSAVRQSHDSTDHRKESHGDGSKTLSKYTHLV